MWTSEGQAKMSSKVDHPDPAHMGFGWASPRGLKPSWRSESGRITKVSLYIHCSLQICNLQWFWV